MCLKGVIDRFEGDLAVIEAEGGEFIHLPLDALPACAKEGSLISMDKDGRVTLCIEETKRQRAKAEELMDRLFED